MEEQIKQELTNGLTSVPMYIPTWYRYDEEGSRLNDMCITNSKWYYFHRYEVNLLQENLQEISSHLPGVNTLVDLGSGNAMKARLIINQMLKTSHGLTYIPVDISEEYLKSTVKEIKEEYGDLLDVQPIAAEYLHAFERLKLIDNMKLIVWLGGLQNMAYRNQIFYLSQIAANMQNGDRLLVTLDVTATSKQRVIEIAYLDPEGYAESFNKNAIHRLNREMDGNIDLSKFSMEDKLVVKQSDEECSYVQLWVEALEKCRIEIKKLNISAEMKTGDKIFLHEGEGISCKYSVDQIRHLCRKASLDIIDYWTNEHVAAVLVSRL